MDILKQGDSERIAVLALDSGGAPVTGGTITAGIMRDADGWWWNGTAFQASYTTVSFTELDNTNLPGVYAYDFRPGMTGFTAIAYVSSATAGITNDPWVRQIRVGSWADYLDAPLSDLADSSNVSQILARLDDTERNYARIVALINRLSSEVRR